MKIRHVRDLRHHAGQLAQRLRHQPRLHAHVAVAHLAFEFGFGHQRRHRVHHQNVDLPRGDQSIGDFEGLLAVIGLGDQQIIDIHAQLAGVGWVERVLHVDESGDAALLLGFRDDLQRDGGFAGGFRAEDFDDAAAGKAADAQGGIERDRAGRDHRDRDDGVLRSQSQDRAFPKLLFDLAEGVFQSARALLFVHAG